MKKRKTRYTGETYTAEMDAPAGNRKVWCGGGCGWSGTFAAQHPIEDCSLTPGDPSPSGRCPECEALAYVVQKGHGA